MCVCTQVAAALLEKLIKGEKKAKKTLPQDKIYLEAHVTSVILLYL